MDLIKGTQGSLLSNWQLRFTEDNVMIDTIVLMKREEH